MKNRKPLVILFFVFVLNSCDSSQRSVETIGSSPAVAIESRPALTSKSTDSLEAEAPTLTELLEKALKTDTVEFYSPGLLNFFVFKSGIFLSETEKNAIAVSCPTDSTYLIKLFTEDDNRWILNDSLNNLSSHPIQFNLDFKDYNFDGQKDIFIQTWITNGIAMSFGHLLTIDPVTKEFIWQIEAEELGSIQLMDKTKIVTSEEVGWCKNNAMRTVCTITNKWLNGHLKTIKRECPCESE